jgi:hypothetical protein
MVVIHMVAKADGAGSGGGEESPGLSISEERCRFPSIKMGGPKTDCFLAAPALAADRPNVSIISIDDLNDWTGCLAGHPQARTPHIDRLANRPRTSPGLA